MKYEKGMRHRWAAEVKRLDDGLVGQAEDDHPEGQVGAGSWAVVSRKMKWMTVSRLLVPGVYLRGHLDDDLKHHKVWRRGKMDFSSCILVI